MLFICMLGHEGMEMTVRDAHVSINQFARLMGRFIRQNRVAKTLLQRQGEVDRVLAHKGAHHEYA
jgi:hypothetical protein